MSLTHLAALACEFACFILALKLVFEKKRSIGIAWAIAFGLYCFYDAALAWHWGVTREFLDAVMLFASVSALAAMWHLAGKRG